MATAAELPVPLEARLTLAHGTVQAVDTLAAVLAGVVSAVRPQLTPEANTNNSNARTKTAAKGGVKRGAARPLSGVLASALAVEVVCTGDARAPVQARVGGTGADADLTVGAHEGGGAFAEVTCGMPTRERQIKKEGSLHPGGGSSETNDFCLNGCLENSA